MPDNNPYKVKIELPDGIDSVSQFAGPDGILLPQRQVLHELIVQTVSERKFVPENSQNYNQYLVDTIEEAQKLSSYKALEQAGDYSPEKISAVLDEMALERLPVHIRAEQVMMVTGGPGTGKSSIVDDLAKTKPEIYSNAVQINPDHYKELLAKPGKLGALHSEYTHNESSMISRKIMDNIDEKMRAGLPAPHVMMDVVSPNQLRMDFAKKFDQMTVVTGTAPPEITIQRAYDRGFNPDGSINGRVIPSSVVLDGAAKSSELMPNIFEHPNLDFKMVDTLPDGKPLSVASWSNETRHLSVHDPDTFIDFVERQNINTSAQSPEELFQDVDRSPQKLAENLKSYTDKGIQIDLLKPDGEVAISISQSKVDIHHALDSKRGAGFMAELAEHTGKLGKNGGVIAGVALGALSGAFTLAAGGSKAEAAQAVYESAVPYGETQFDLAHGDLAAAERSATIETVSNTGAAGGALAGAAIGTVILPGIGTAIGAIVGGVGVGVGAGYVTEKIYDNYEVIKGSAVHVAQETAENLNRAVQNSKALLVSWFDKSPALDAQIAFKALPDFATPDMPPEVAALVEVKASPELFEKRFAEIKEHGGLPEVVAYIENHPEHTKQKSPDAQDQSLNYAHSFSPVFA